MDFLINDFHVDYFDLEGTLMRWRINESAESFQSAIRISCSLKVNL